MAPFSPPFQLARARSRCCRISASKPSRSMSNAALARDVFLLVEREAVGVVELEGDRARHRAVRRVREISSLKDLLGDEERGGVAMLFVFDDAGDALHGFHHLRIGRAHVLGDEAGELIEIRFLLADQAGVAHGAAHDFAQHVAAAFIRRQHAVVDQEGGGAGVIGVDAQRGVGLRVDAVFDAAEFAGAVDDGADEIGVVVRELALQDGGDALEAHAGIDGRARQRRHCCPTRRG